MDSDLILYEEPSEYKRVTLEKRLILFAIQIDSLCGKLPNTSLGNYIADNMVRASASTAFNYGEAQSAESKKDFIHKMKICLKELREYFVSLKFIKYGSFKINMDDSQKLYQENNELISIFVRSIQTARKNS